MKTMKMLGIFFLISMLIGIATIAVFPPQANAGPDPCNTACYSDFCPGPVGGNCQSPYVSRNRCYSWALMDCEFASYNCRCVFTGCCIPF